MKWSVSILFSVLLISSVIATANAQSSPIANHVVINEVDLNPPGDDSVTVSEWVELYNPTSSPVDLSGWKIASTTILKKTMTIPAGTIINPGQFKTFSYQSLWFTDVSESVELRDINGQIIDKTPSFSDIKSDFTSWQRIYDGYDLDSVDDWKFVTSNAGSSNGKLSSEVTSDAVTVNVSTDKQNYTFGETVILSGSVSEKVFIEKPYFQPEKIIVKINGPAYYNILEFYPDYNLKYKTTLNLHKVLGFNEGTYSVSVSYGDAIDNTSFSLGFITQQEQIVTESELSLSTDKPEYIPGQTVKLSGITSDIAQFEGLKFKVVNPDGIQIFDGTLYPNTSGQFSTTFFLNTVNPVYGEYIISAEYSDQSAQTTFSISEDVKEDVLISLWTDKNVYGLGETVQINGRLNNFWVPVLDLEIVQTSSSLASTGGDTVSNTLKILDAVRVEGDGKFSYSFTISNDKSRLGDYKIVVSKDIGKQSKSIVVVSDPSTYVASTEELVISTDKTAYDLGLDTKLTISGKIKNYAPRSSFETPTVKFTISDSEGKLLTFTGLPEGGKRLSTGGITVTYELTAIPEASGAFSTSIDLSRLLFAEGTHTIHATYLDKTAKTTFDLREPIQLDGNTIQATLDKSVYGLGETVTLNGIIPPVGEGGVKITLIKPDGSKRDSGATTDNQRFTWTWNTPLIATSVPIKTEDRSFSSSNLGIYKITVSLSTISKTVFFKLSEDPLNNTLEIPPLSVSTEKSIYQPGEKLKVIGQVNTRLQGTEGLVVPDRVSIKVLSGKFPYPVIHEASVYPKQGGTFSSLFELPSTIFTTGEYKVTASYENKKVETIFSVASGFSFGNTDPVSLIASTDKTQYYPGDTVFVSGKPNKLIYIEKFEVSVIKKSATEITCGSFYCGTHAGPITQIRPSPDGSFSYVYPIPDKPTSIGSYEVTIDMDFDTKSIKFDVVEEPPHVEPELSTRLIEKENRISENEITVKTQEKSLNNLTWAPRVLQGSMLTPEREDISSVNLQVTSESGICIIGQTEECLIKDSTRKPSAIYDVIEIDGQKFNVRYSGPDVRLEKFSILPESDSEYLPDASWNIEVIKDDEVTRLYYKINYSLLE